jgi:hypothetical protein
MHRFRLAFLTAITLVLLAGSAWSIPAVEILAFVDEDTLTTDDLRIELNLMEKRSNIEGRKVLPEPDAVLRRLIQNRLIVQEGYRMGLDQEFTVNNQVTEAVNARCMGALLDSVALAVPKDSSDLKGARSQAVKDYIENLIVIYDVQVDSTLLKSLDYGSAEQEMRDWLRDSDEILAVVPTGTLKVSSFSRLIRFTAFHGLEGKPDAAQRRDRILSEWVSEAVTIHETRQQNIRQRPVIQLYQNRLERTLMLEETLKILLQFPFEPTAEEIEAYHQQYIDRFLKPTQVKMESLKFATEEAAQTARKRLIQGAKMSWVKRNMEQVVDGPPPFPVEWFEAGKLDITSEQARLGYIPEPYGVPGGWVLAQVSQVQEPTATPVSECKDLILKMMKADATNELMQDIIRRLEEVVEVRVQPGAEDAVGRVLAELEEMQ